MREPEGVAKGFMFDWQLDVVSGWPAVATAVEGCGLEWQRLVDTATGMAVYQSPGFVLTWYEVYESSYEPLLLLGSLPAGTLAGVLPLALARNGDAR